MDELTMEDIRKAMKLISENNGCNKQHNPEITGCCVVCGMAWLGEADYKNVIEFMNYKLDECEVEETNGRNR